MDWCDFCGPTRVHISYTSRLTRRLILRPTRLNSQRRSQATDARIHGHKLTHRNRFRRRCHAPIATTRTVAAAPRPSNARPYDWKTSFVADAWPPLRRRPPLRHRYGCRPPYARSAAAGRREYARPQAAATLDSLLFAAQASTPVPLIAAGGRRPRTPVIGPPASCLRACGLRAARTSWLAGYRRVAASAALAGCWCEYAPAGSAASVPHGPAAGTPSARRGPARRSPEARRRVRRAASLPPPGRRGGLPAAAFTPALPRFTVHLDGRPPDRPSLGGRRRRHPCRRRTTRTTTPQPARQVKPQRTRCSGRGLNGRTAGKR